MSRRTRITLHASGPFDFRRTATSHGWVVLAPNAWDPARGVLERTHRLASGRVVLLEVSGGEAAAVAVTARCRGSLSGPERREVRDAVAHMLRLDEDLSPFHRICAERGGPWAQVAAGRGRLLRSPTVFEDVVKTILTTNVQWGGTKRMARELVEAFGEPSEPHGPCEPSEPHTAGVTAEGSDPGDPPRRAFPTAEAIARASPEEFAGSVGLGYRAAYVHGLARRVASGELELEALGRSDLATPELEGALRGIRGVGPYAAATLLMLLGRYDALPVDTVFRSFVSERYFGGERVADAELRAVYEPWGPWKYLAYWCELVGDDGVEGA